MSASNNESGSSDSISPAELISGIAENSRKASRTLASAPSSQKNDFLLRFAELLVKETDNLLSENAKGRFRRRRKRSLGRPCGPPEA